MVVAVQKPAPTARSAAVQALKLLSPSLFQSSPSLKQQALLQLLNHSVVLGSARKVAAQAVKTLRAYDDMLFKGLCTAQGLCRVSACCVCQ